MRRLETACDRPCVNRFADAFELMASEIDMGKMRGRQLLGRTCDDDRVRSRQTLQPGCKIRRLADDDLFL